MKIGFVGLLGLLFIALKLTGYINWSWFWVLSPLLAVPLFLVFLFIVLVTAELVKAVAEHKS